MHEKNRSVHKINSAYMKQYEAQQRRQQIRKKKLKRRIIGVTLIVLIIFGVMGSYHLDQRKVYSEKQEEYEQLKKQLVQLNEDEQKYLEEISLLSNDEYVLEIARTNYFFSKEGELIFKILDEDSSY